MPSRTLTYRLYGLIALWGFLGGCALYCVRIWNARMIQSESPRELSAITLALLVWIAMLVCAVGLIKVLRRSDSLTTIAARVFVFAIPLQFMGYGGSQGLRLGLVDVGDIFLKGYLGIWLIVSTLIAGVMTWRIVRNAGLRMNTEAH